MKILLMGLIFSIAAQAQEMRPFNTDLCTLYPEGTRESPQAWAHCCIEHDLYLWAGGTIQERKEVDQALKTCVVESGYPEHAELIYRGVRLGSLSPIKFPQKSWGNAWIDRKKDLALTESDNQLLIEKILNHPMITTEMYENFIKNLNERLNRHEIFLP